MNLAPGIKLLEQAAGTGAVAEKGCRVVYNLRIFLNQGDEVPLNERQAQNLPDNMLRKEGDAVLVEHTITLGKRQAIAGIEYALAGMKAGGYRKVKVGPHLAYREQGLPGLIPENATLTLAIWLRHVYAEHDKATG
jgi:hypothetical protein